MARLSDRDIDEAAAEAGISPRELRETLMEREGLSPSRSEGSGRSGHENLPARRAPEDTVAVLHGQVNAPPEQAIKMLRAAFERRLGRTGHQQGPMAADIVDEDAGVTTRLVAESDERGGALVRAEIDPSHDAARQTMYIGSATVVGILAFALGVLLSSTFVVGGGLGILTGAGLSWLGGRMRRRRALEAHRSAAASALLDAEDRAAFVLTSGEQSEEIDARMAAMRLPVGKD